MRRIVWSEEARENLRGIQAYVADFSPSAAARLGVRIIDLVESLAIFPDRGRPIRPGVRELTRIRPYVIRYGILDDEVRVMTIRHAARRSQA